MSSLVIVELDGNFIKKTSLEAVSCAATLSELVHIVVFGNLSSEAVSSLGDAGANQIHQITHEVFRSPIGVNQAMAVSELATSLHIELIIASKSTSIDSLSGHLAIRLNAALVNNVVELPKKDSTDFIVKQSIYTGKAFVHTKVSGIRKILVIKKNAVNIGAFGKNASVVDFVPQNIPSASIKITKTERATGQILLPEADIVVSGGRGLKGPENWGMVEELAAVLGAATGCSKPVSDMNWRPHHEHVGQTGVKVAPTLYIAIGISGAIQHLAGVNSSKCIVVINKDAEAPFFKAADYGIVGDAFDVIPKLTAAIKAAQA